MRKYVTIFIFLLLLSGCNKKDYFSGEAGKANVEIRRFDNAIYELTKDSTKLESVMAEYPDFFPIFSGYILDTDPEDLTALREVIPTFLNDTIVGVKDAYEREQEIFADISDIQEELNMAFGRLLYLFPDFYVPTITVFVGGFNYQISLMDDDLAIGADMFLGSDYEVYNHLYNVYQYQKPTMEKSYVSIGLVKTYLYQHIPFASNKSRLLENMIHGGKIMWLLQQLLPDKKPWEIMAWTEEQWKWCNQYEKDIWRLMMDKKDLYKSEQTVLASYLNDGPFTSEISQDSPARTGTWIGWQIVDAYMKNNPDVSIQQMLAEGDVQTILENSKYRP